jgi:UDP-perosamine 4-acetyltransferase
MQKVVILGSGGHAKVVIEIMRQVGLYDAVGCVGPAISDTSSIHGLPNLGDDDCLPELRAAGISCAFVALGDNRLRRRLMLHIMTLGFELASAISPAATLSPSASLGSGLAIMPGANIGPDTVIANGAIVNSRASVDHDGALGECCHIGPGATLAGCVSVGAEAFVATGSSVIPGITIGAGSLVGAGSVVVRDIPANVLAYGCPARRQRDLNPPAGPPSPVDRQDDRPAAVRSLRLVV